MTTDLKNPKTLRLVSWNCLKDRPDKQVIGDIRRLTRELAPHAVALQETRDYLDVLERVPGYDLHADLSMPGSDQNAFLVREDIAAKDVRCADLGGDGWTTVTGHKHVGCKTTSILLANWLRTYTIHLPPSINWPNGKPVGPSERVDDYKANMRALRKIALRADNATSRIREPRQVGRYGSDHPAILVKIMRVAEKRGLAMLGDFNCKPGRDEGEFTVGWLAREGGMRIAAVKGVKGHLSGIDNVLVKVES